MMFIYEKAPFPSCHASTLIETAPGQLLAAWFGGKEEGAKDVRIWWSKFDGKSWTAPEVAAEEKGQPCWNPVLLKVANGDLVLWYKAGPSPQTWTGFVRRSSDGGKTWSPSEIMPAGTYGPIRAKPIQLANGTILAGTSVETYKVWTAYVDRSTDNGKTWTRSTPIQVPGRPYGLIQPTLARTSDGRLLAWCRSRDTGFICMAESKDDGITFGPATLTDLPNPSSGIDVVTLADGSFVMLYNHTKVGRFPLNLSRSTDDGKTWKPLATVEKSIGEFSYPAMIVGSDGKLHLTYTWNRTHIRYRAIDPNNPMV
ncbi:Uncharacterized protein OS=uncultured bacterium GN=ACD_37C00268G0002 PE=4 SV=1: BNR_2 [Tuwongella immobilis]|uniref:Sialidase domain-containing protein n=2 Tax=Tuwongella immobilis TaxID=692036 RepID=A0A6C2YSM1_9BACT|nr:Uncharacterized protein OS=uncultured bacterium GN=ACD_37C00268G0002 PE=4 SV=1: BNR_2 [Tuwongella immobilis]VTS06759.1 Uncharacterized protein OS=uncultured bacterium GN=ACD_37C00268G0002 PE=4 SV=1: BNR_2 [Tuwongella immobilis]